MSALACAKIRLDGDTQGHAAFAICRSQTADRLIAEGGLEPYEIRDWGDLDRTLCDALEAYIKKTGKILDNASARYEDALKNKAGDFGGNQNAAPI